MQNQHILTKGDFCWTELSTPNLTASKNFYQEIFNWNYADHTMQAGVYSMMRVGEDELGGAYEVTEEMKAHGVPSVWHAYVLVDDVNKMTQKAKELGAHIIREPLEVMEMGKMAVFADPTGAVISIWQTNGQPGKSLDKNKHGATTWFELKTTDMKKAGEFYSQLFGWDMHSEEVQPGMQYVTFKNGPVPVAGMIQLTDKMVPMPSNWSIYFNVSNLDAAIEKAKKMGGSVLYHPVDMPKVGRFTAIQDPEGVVFSVIQYTN